MAYKTTNSCNNIRLFSQIVINKNNFRKRCISISMSDAINKAEIVLGYSIKDLSVKKIDSDLKFQVMFNKCLNFKSDNPLVLAQRKLDPELEPNYKSRALVTLLLAKVVEAKTLPQFKFNLNVQKSGFLTKQLLLAETIELIYGGCVYHTIGITPIKKSNSDLTESIQANRLAILKGDSMFTNATKNLVKLKNSRVTEMMGKSLKEFIEGEYLSIKIREQIGLGEWCDVLDNWVKMTFLQNASLIASGCQSMIHLSGNNDSDEESVHKFGNNIGFAWKIVDELHDYNQSLINDDIFDDNLSLPILLHLRSNPHLKSLMNESDRKSFFKNIIKEVNKSDAIDKTKSLLEFYSENAIKELNNFEDSEAKIALTNMIKALKN